MGRRRISILFRAGACVVGVASALAYSSAHAFQSRIDETDKSELKHFDIKAQPLAHALETFAAQSGIQFLLRASLVDGIEAEGVRGRMSDVDALSKLLNGTGLAADFTASDVIVISQLAAPDEEAAPQTDDVVFRDELIVSARRREERLNDHPGVAATFNRQQLRAMQVDGAEDIIYNVANAHIEERPGSQVNIYIRGVGTETSGSGTRTDAGIGLYYDGVYTYLQGSRIPSVYYDLERVEVLKGPQGGLYGRNAIGGAVIVTPASPENTFGARLRFEGGNYGHANASGFVNAPIGEKAALRISGLYARQNSIYENALTNDRERGDRTFSFRTRVKFEPVDAAEILVGYERTREDKGAQIVVPNEFGLNHVSVADIDGFIRRNTDRVIAKSAWTATPGWQLQTVTGYTNLSARSAHDFNNVKFRSDISEYFIGEERRSIEAWQFSQSILAVSTTERPLQWLIGAEFFADNQEVAVDILSGFESLGLAETQSGSQSRTRVASAFADVSYDLTPKLTANASLRYSNETRRGASSDSVIASSESGGLIAAPFRDFQITYGKLSPAISVQYEFTPSIKAFAKITTGYQSGGINTRAASNDVTAFGPSTAVNYEAGFRTRWLDDRLLLNVALFQLNQNDFHYRLDNPPFDEFVNNGKARTYGADIELVAAPADWIEIIAAYGYLDARITSAPNGLFLISPDDRKSGSPLHSATIGINIEKPLNFLDNGIFRMNVNYFMARDRYIRDRTVPLEDYDIINLKTGVLFNDRHELYVYAQNLTNDVNTITPSIDQSRLISPPRIFGVGFAIRR